MTIRKTLLLAASASAIALLGGGEPAAQTGAATVRIPVRDEATRLRAETAHLYASAIARLAAVSERDLRDDAGTSVIAALRAGRIEDLPSLDDETRDLVRNLGIEAFAVDVDPGAGVDERIAVFAREGELRHGATRADIEREAAKDGKVAIVRFQSGVVAGGAGSFPIPAEAPGGLAEAAAVGVWFGASGADKVTSGGDGSRQLRALACDAGFFGAGIVEERQVDRSTELGGAAREDFSDWAETARDCDPERARRVRFFDICAGPDGVLGTGDDDASGLQLYEAPQHVRMDASDPFAAELFVDRAAAVSVGGAGCMEGDRLPEFADFLIDGRTAAEEELRLKSQTSEADLGNGPGKAPGTVATATGSVVPVSGIPFPANGPEEFRYSRSCVAEHGDVPAPDGYEGPTRYAGRVEYFRDYNRRETYFSDDRLGYILNYEIVLDPSPHGHAPKGRSPIPAARGSVPETDGPVPAGDGWHKFGDTCSRELRRTTVETRRRECGAVHPAWPDGSVAERREGVGRYLQTTPDNPVPDGPTLERVDWSPWREMSNDCSRTTETRTVENRTLPVRVGGRSCQLRQTRTRVDRVTEYLTGEIRNVSFHDPDWTDLGSPSGCRNPGGGGDGGGNGNGDGQESVDVDGDGKGDYSSIGDARRNGHENGRTVSGGCGSCKGPKPGNGSKPGSGNSGGGGGGGDGGGDGCFAPGTPVLMADGTEKPIEEVAIGDEIAEGGIVLVAGAFLSSDLWRIDGIRVTGMHAVRTGHGWIRAKDHPGAVREIPRRQKTFNLIASNNRMICGGMLFADQAEFGGAFLDEVLARGEDERLARMNAEADNGRREGGTGRAERFSGMNAGSAPGRCGNGDGWVEHLARMVVEIEDGRVGSGAGRIDRPALKSPMAMQERGGSGAGRIDRPALKNPVAMHESGGSGVERAERHANSNAGAGRREASRNPLVAALSSRSAGTSHGT